MKIDLTPIFNLSELNSKALLIIEPLAPISMVSDLPGSYYKSTLIPSKYQLCGLFENLLGWHIGSKDRKEIFKKLKKHYKDSFNIELENPKSNSGYEPLIYHLFDIDPDGKILYPQRVHFDDLWKKSFRRTDAVVHPKGTQNIDFSLIRIKRSLSKKENSDQVEDKELEQFFKENLGGFPFYYSTLASREYILASGHWEIPLLISNKFLLHIIKSLEQNGLAYLGTSDSWVNIKIEIL